MMMAATVIDDLIYHHPLFIALWAVVAVSGMLYLFVRGAHKRFATLGLHLSFVIILIGAMVTYLFGQQGEMTILPGETASSFTLEDGSEHPLPFQIRLDKFTVEYYPGSKAPSDFRSDVTVDGENIVISMNNILKRDGYRFYQADFDPETGSSTLAVSHDPAGVGITYTGYLLLLLSMIAFFFEKNSGFRAALKRVMAAAAVVFAFCLPVQEASAAPVQDAPRVIPEEVAEAFGDLYVYYNDRVCPMQTLAREYCMKVYGKPKWGDYSAEQVLTGWLFYYDDWKVIPVKVKAKERGTKKQNEKEYIVRSVSSGEALKMFPVRDLPDSLSGGDTRISWYASEGDLPAWVFNDYDQWVFIRKVLAMMGESVRDGDWEQVSFLTGKIRSYQEKTAASVLPSPVHFRAEKLYNVISRPRIPFMAAITLGMLLFILSGIALSRGKKLPMWLQWSVVALTLVLLLYLTTVLGLRWYVSGHAPFAGSYCVMLLMAWLSCLAVLLLWKKVPLVLSLGWLLAGFTMLMASLSSANPRITHMMPVLQSPLLSIHVLCMMFSYTLFGLAALNGILGLLVKGKEPSGKLQDISLVVLYPAVFLLTAGTFIGAVWANISWGNYWSWDPKETWALITLLIYAFSLHGSSLKAFRNPKFFHLYTILAFLSVLVTYFGVNMLMGGMHAYA